jgi:predicted O-methyltransferase YrrM
MRLVAEAPSQKDWSEDRWVGQVLGRAGIPLRELKGYIWVDHVLGRADIPPGELKGYTPHPWLSANSEAVALASLPAEDVVAAIQLPQPEDFLLCHETLADGVHGRPNGSRTRRGELVAWRVPEPDTALHGSLHSRPRDGQHSSTLVDCLGRAEITLPDKPISAERCIATIISSQGSSPRPGYPFRKNYLGYLDDMLGSLAANADCRDARVVVFVVGDEPEGERIASKHGATIVPCRPLTKINTGLKSVMYSIARVVSARFFLCLDADMLILGDLKPIFSALEVLPESTVLAAPDCNHTEPMTLLDALQRIYWGSEVDLYRLLGTPNHEAQYPLVVNDGLFAASRTALLAVDKCIRAMPEAVAWTDERDDIWWRNQFVFNLALAKLRCGMHLDHSYNLQLHSQDAEVHCGPGGPRAYWQGRPVKVLHRSGQGPEKHPDLIGSYSRIERPLNGPGVVDSYTHFLRVLRAWIGRHGVAAMAWSFYGTADTLGGRIRDPDAMPLLGLLHYLIRSNGCIRVLETGTARGVSAACMASALAHRCGGQVVTLDRGVLPEREDLWAALPASVRACIQPRAVDAIRGMISAWDAGERYDAALLDTVHTQEQVWSEFQWATKLVCPGGLILIHDACWASGTVEGALKQVSSAGYGVVRLWTAESGVCEDDHLGLAVIENRQYSA